MIANGEVQTTFQHIIIKEYFLHKFAQFHESDKFDWFLIFIFTFTFTCFSFNSASMLNFFSAATRMSFKVTFIVNEWNQLNLKLAD